MTGPHVAVDQSGDRMMESERVKMFENHLLLTNPTSPCIQWEKSAEWCLLFSSFKDRRALDWFGTRRRRGETPKVDTC